MIKSLYLIAYSFISFLGFSQSEITGTLQNSDGEPLIFASLYLKTEKYFTSSQEGGEFTLSIKSNANINDTLLIRYIGYKTKIIPISINGSRLDLGNIVLDYEFQIIDEVRVVAPPPIKKILRRTYKNVKKNYANQSASFSGFYRELMQENDSHIEMNEAFVEINYSKYPAQWFIKKSFRDYWMNRATSKTMSSFGNIFSACQYFPYFISPKDEVFIREGRKSQNLSLFGNRSSPMGGPNDLLALDKVKYAYDFLDPKLRSKYKYTNTGKRMVNGELCFRIEFKPKAEEIEKVFHNYSKKMEYAIYSGFLYISVETYAIVQFSGQKFVNSNFEIYLRNKNGYQFPSSIYFTVDYKDYDGRFTLDKVTTEQVVNKSLKNGNIVRYNCLRELTLNPIETKESDENDFDQFYAGANSSLRGFTSDYNENFWKSYELTKNYRPLDSAIRNELERRSSLEFQFLEQNKSISDIAVPYTGVISNLNPSNKLYYKDLKIIYDSLYFDFLQNENKYYSTITQKTNRYKGLFTRKYFSIYEETGTIDQAYFVIDGYKLIQTRDSSNYANLSFFESKEKILNLTKLSKGKLNFNIENIRFNDNNQIAVSYSEKGNMSNTLEVYDYSIDSLIFKEISITDFFWINDSTLIYSKVDSTQRPYQIIVKNVVQNGHSNIFETPNSSLELSLEKSTFQNEIFLNVEDKQMNYYLVYSSENNQFVPLIEEKKNTNYLIDCFQDDTFITVKKMYTDEIMIGQLSRALSIDSNETIYSTDASILEIKRSKDYLVFVEFVNGQSKLKTISLMKHQATNLEVIDGFNHITIDEFSILNNSIIVSVESAIHAHYQLSIDLENQLIDTIYKSEVIPEFHSSNYIYEYLLIPVSDSINVPASVLYHKKYKGNIQGLLIKGYGAYGSMHIPSFNSTDLIYANSGVCIAQIYPRGSGVKGKTWHDEGRLLNKKNTFSDYVYSVEYLQSKLNVAKKKTIGYGTSAGGVIMGVVANSRPDLFGALIFDKGYLDVLNSMSNPKLPLVTLESSEWGNMQDTSHYNYVSSYSPFQNIHSQDYPNMMFFAKYHDMQTPYWDIAKSVAKYRSVAINDPIILFNTDFNAGHRGNTNYLIEIDNMADQYAFVMYTLNQKNK